MAQELVPVSERAMAPGWARAPGPVRAWARGTGPVRVKAQDREMAWARVVERAPQPAERALPPRRHHRPRNR